MRTYHALYKPAARANPRRTRPVAKQATPRLSRSRLARRNPASSQQVAGVVAKVVDKDIQEGFSGQSSFYSPKTMAPAGILFLAPGDDVEYGEKVYRGDPKQWKWFTFSNGGLAISEGKEVKREDAVTEASMSLVTWALPMVAATHDRLQKAGKSEDEVIKAMAKFTVRDYTPDGKALPKAGKTTKIKGPGRMTAKITGEKSKKGQPLAGPVVWYVEVFDDDGKPIGAGEGKKTAKIGPLLDGAALHGILNSMWGLLQGEEDAIEANPVQRKRLGSTARRKTARKNGLLDMVAAPILGMPSTAKIKEKAGRLDAEDVGEFQSSMGIPADPHDAYQIGYYRGILRGINSCKWYPDPIGFMSRWAFRRDMNKRLVDAYNNLSQDMSKTPKNVRVIRQQRKKRS